MLDYLGVFLGNSRWKKLEMQLVLLTAVLDLYSFQVGILAKDKIQRIGLRFCVITKFLGTGV